jgi:small subunit ribosomal protein S20
MPHHKAAMKHLRASKKRRIDNKAQKSQTRTAIKKVMEAGEKDKAQQTLVSATSLLDRLSRKGIMHRNTVARTKSKLTRKVNALGEKKA